MTQQEFEKLAGHKIDSKSYELIERIYNEVSFSKNEFVAEVKCMSSGIDICESNIVLELLRKVEGYKKAHIEEYNKNIERAHLLIRKACAFDDQGLYNMAIDIIGANNAIRYKIENNLPLCEYDQKYLLKMLSGR